MNKQTSILCAGIAVWALLFAVALFFRREASSAAANAETCDLATASAAEDCRRLDIYRECEKWLFSRDNTRFSPPAGIPPPDSRELHEEADAAGTLSIRRDSLRWDKITPADAFAVAEAACSARKSGWRLSSLDIAPAPGEEALSLSIAFTTARRSEKER